MSALLLSTACMRGLWPLLMSWLKIKSTMGKLNGLRDGECKICVVVKLSQCWLSAAQWLTIALMSAPASSSILAKSLCPRSTPRWRGLKPENRDKAEPEFYIEHIDVQDIRSTQMHKTLHIHTPLWACLYIGYHHTQYQLRDTGKAVHILYIVITIVKPAGHKSLKNSCLDMNFLILYY